MPRRVMPSVRPNALARPLLAGRALMHVACETLALGCLFERRGDAYIRIPVHRRQQARGCEWHSRRPGGRLLGVSYTLEALEDWLALAREAPGQVAALYRAILGRPDIPADDLRWRADVYARTPEGYVPAFRAGSYNPLNPWNTIRGAVHLNGLSEPGFEAGARPEAWPLRLAGGVPEHGLLFLRGRDRTAEVLRTAHGQGPRGRLEVTVPEGEPWSLDDLLLPDGEPFTPLGLFRALLGRASGDRAAGSARDHGSPGSVGRGADASRPAAPRGALPFLPGRLVTDALLRQARLTPQGAAMA